MATISVFSNWRHYLLNMKEGDIESDVFSPKLADEHSFMSVTAQTWLFSMPEF